MRSDVIYHHEDWQREPFLTFLARQWRRAGRVGLLPGVNSVAPAGEGVAAYVSEGRWVAFCPSGDGGALCLSRDLALFLCPECWNAAIGGVWRPVQYPSAEEKAAIEATLLARPETDGWRASTRNWFPDESVESLEQETVAYLNGELAVQEL